MHVAADARLLDDRTPGEGSPLPEPLQPQALSGARSIESTVVEQTIDRERRGRFLRETIEVPLERGALLLVRKQSARPFVERRGAVLLCHGFAQNRYSWHLERRSFSNYLADEGFDVFNFDLRGAGRSKALGAPTSGGFHDHVEGDLPPVVDAALRASGERSLFLVGHSMGGAISCAHAGRDPERVRGVVAISGLYGFGARSRVIRGLATLAGLLERGALIPESLPTDTVGRLLQWSRRIWDHPLSALLPVQAWAPSSIEREVLDESMRRSFEPSSREVTLALARMARGGPFGDAQGRSYFPAFEARRDIPLLVIAGGADQLVAPEDSRQAYDRSSAGDKTCILLDGRDDREAYGHVDVIIGRHAPAQVWPVIRGWMAAR